MFLTVLFSLIFMSCTDTPANIQCTPPVVIKGFASKAECVAAAKTLGETVKAANGTLIVVRGACKPVEQREA